jgi:hypothetical protein
MCELEWKKTMGAQTVNQKEMTRIAITARNILNEDTCTVADSLVRLCDLLSKPENHITIRAEPHKPVRTIQDMVNEMPHELSNLPRFTAYAKVLQQKGGMGEIQLTIKEKIITLKLQQELSVLGYISANLII